MRVTLFSGLNNRVKLLPKVNVTCKPASFIFDSDGRKAFDIMFTVEANCIIDTQLKYRNNGMKDILLMPPALRQNILPGESFSLKVAYFADDYVDDLDRALRHHNNITVDLLYSDMMRNRMVTTLVYNRLNEIESTNTSYTS